MNRFNAWALPGIVSLVAVLALVTGVMSVSRGDSVKDTTANTGVEVAPEGLAASLTTCAQSSVTTCVTEWAEQALDSVGVKEALQLASATGDKLVERICHGVMHDLGRLSVQRGGAPEETLLLGSGACNFGFEHGVLIGVAKSDLTQDEFSAKMAVVCDGYPRERSEYASCVHGIGHAATVRTPQDPKAAGDVCAVLGEDGSWCVSGVVMEWGTSGGAGKLKREGFQAANEVCDKIAETALKEVGRNECAKEMPEVITASGASKTDAAKWCLTAGGEAAQEMCAKGVHFTFATQTEVSIEEVKSVCTAAFSGRAQGVCVGAAATLYTQPWITVTGGKVEDLCTGLDADGAAACKEAKDSSALSTQGRDQLSANGN